MAGGSAAAGTGREVTGMIVTKVLCDNCGEEIEGNPFVILKVNHGRDNHYCFECGKVLLDGWMAAARQSQIDMEWRKPEEISAEQEALAAEKVEIKWIVDLLARNGVQWPNRSNDIGDTKWLSRIWNRIIREHLAVEIERRKGMK